MDVAALWGRSARGVASSALFSLVVVVVSPLVVAFRPGALQKAKDALRQAVGSIQDGQTTQNKDTYVCIYVCIYVCTYL